MPEPNVPDRDDTDLPTTAPTTPRDTLFKERSGLTRDLLDIQTRLGHAQDRIALSQYGDPSLLGADRARISFAMRLIAEVSLHVTDLAFGLEPGGEAAA